MSRSRQLSIILGVVCAVLLAACGGDDDEPRADPTTTAPTTTESQESEDEEALRQLAEDWYAAIDAIYNGEAELDSAEQFVADPYLTGFEGQVEEFRRNGHQVERDPVSSHAVRSVEVQGDRAVVIECVIDADVLLDSQGEVLNDEVQANLYSTIAVRGADGWRLTDREILSETEGSSCPDQ